MSRSDVAFDRRVQLLLDRETYQLVADEAESTGRSVNAVLRDAIAARYADREVEARRREAAEQLLARLAERRDEPSYTIEELREGHYGEGDGRLPIYVRDGV